MTNPSAIILATICTFYRNVFTGWKLLEDATINGDGFTVNFYRLGERTIDTNCDALNGWHTIWTKYLIELITKNGKREMVVSKGETADKLFNLFKNVGTINFDEEGEISAREHAEIAFDSLNGYIN